jgi:hypothetical protein
MERWVACSPVSSTSKKPHCSALCGSMHTLVQFRSADEPLSRDLLEDDTSWGVQKEKAWYSWLYWRAAGRSAAVRFNADNEKTNGHPLLWATSFPFPFPFHSQVFETQVKHYKLSHVFHYTTSLLQVYITTLSQLHRLYITEWEKLQITEDFEGSGWTGLAYTEWPGFDSR